MKKFELYFIRTFLIAVLAVLAVSPIVATVHLWNGLASATLDVTHLLSLGYLLMIAFGLFLISPAFSEGRTRPHRAHPHPER